MVRWLSLKSFISILLFIFFSFVFQDNIQAQCTSAPNAIGGFVPDKTCATVNVTLSTFSHTIPGNIPSGSVYKVDWDDGTVDSYTTIVDDEDLNGHFSHNYVANVNECSYQPVFTISNPCGSDQISGSVNVWDTEQLFLAVSADGQVCETHAITWNFTDESNWNCFAPTFGDANDGDRTISWDYGTAGTTLTTALDNIDIDGTIYNNGDFPHIGTPTTQATSGSLSLDITLPATVTAEGQAGNMFEVTMNLWNDCNPYDADGDGLGPDNPPKSITCYIIVLDAPLAPTASDQDFCYDGIGNLTATGTTGVLNWYSDAALTSFLGSGTSFAHGETTSGSYTYYVAETIGNNCEGPATTVTMVIRNELSVNGSINGDNEICPEESGLTYSVTDDPANETYGGTTEYVWSVPSGFSITGGQGTKTITVDVDGGTVTPGTNTISVYRRYTDQSPACDSPSKTLDVTVNPYPAAEIYYDASYCAGLDLKLKFKNLTGISSNYDINYTDGTSTWTASTISSSGETYVVPFGDAAHPGNGTQTTYTIVEVRDQDADGCVSNISDPNSAGQISGSATATFRVDLNAEAEIPTGITGPNPVCQDVDGYNYSVVPYIDPVAKSVGTYDGTTRYYWWEKGFSRSGSRYEKDVTFNADNTARTNGYVYVRWEYSSSANEYVSSSYKRCKSDWVRIYPITVNKKPTATITSSDFTVCDGDNADIDITFTGQNANGPWDLNYEVNGVPLSVSGIATSNYTLTITAAQLTVTGGDNTVELTSVSENSGAPANCPNTLSGETITITNNTLPDATIGSGAETICETGTTSIKVDLTGMGVGDWVVEYNINGGGSLYTATINATPYILEISGGDFNIGANTVNVVGVTQDKGAAAPCATVIVGQSVAITVDQQPTVATVGTDQSFCTTTDLVSNPLGGNDPTSGTGIWIEDAGNPLANTLGAVNDSNTIATIGGVGDAGVYSYTWTITNGVCPASEATIKVDFGASPPFPDAGADSTLCMPSLKLYANDPGIGTGLWTDSGPGTITYDDPNDSTATITADASGTYTLTWTISSGTCVSNSNDVLIKFNPEPTLNNNAVTPAALCEDNSGLGIANVNLTDQEATIYAGAHTFAYFSDAGMTTSVPDETDVNALEGSVYYVSVTDGGTGCSSPATITYSVNAQPTCDVTGTATLCNGDSTDITITFTGTGPWDFTYTDGVTPVTVNNNAANPYVFTVSPTAPTVQTDTTYSVTYLHDGGVNCDGSDFGTTATVTVNPLPTAIMSGTTTICAGENTGIQIALTGSPNFEIKYDDGTDDFTISGIAASPEIITVTPDETTTYKVFSVTDNNCTGTIGASDSSATVTVTDLPTVTTLGTTSICEGDNTDVTFIFTGATPWTFTYTDGTTPTTLVTANDTVVVNVSPLNNTTYSVTVLSDATCTGNDFGADATITVNPLPTASVNGTATICDGETTTISVTLTGTAPWNITTYDGSVFTDVVGIGASPYTFDVSPSANTTYSVTAVSDAKCTGSSFGATATVTVHPLPTANITSSTDVSLCTGQSTNINIALTEGTSWDIDYKIGSTAQTQINTSSDPYTLTTSTAGAYVITRVENNNGCVQTSFDDTVNIVVNALPTADMSGDATICEGDSTPVTIDLTGATPWIVTYNDGADHIISVTDASHVFYDSPSADVTYTLVSVTDNNTCDATAMLGNADITVKPVPDVPTLTTGDTSVCVLDNEATYRITNTAGNTYSWYIPGAFFDAGGTHDIGGGINTTNYYLGLIYGGDPFADTLKIIQMKDGCTSDTLFVNLEALALPVADAGNDTIICEGEEVQLGGSPSATEGSGDYLYDWVPASTLDNNKIANPTATPILTTEYALEVDDNQGGCVSEETALSKVNVTVNVIPDAPTADSKEICFGEATPNLEATGSNIQWYSDELLTDLVNNGNTFVTGKTAVGVYTYYVTQTTNSCESEATVVTLTIYAIPDAPGTEDEVICSGEITPTLDATGNSITWYNDITLTDIEGTGNTLSTGEFAVGVYTYYVTQTENGCESPSETSTLTINAIPTAPLATDETICFGETTPDLEAIGSNINWYQDIGLTVLLANGSPYATGQTNEGTYKYYVTQTENSCESAYTLVELTINSLPAVVVQTSTDQTVCNSEDGTITLLASGYAPLTYTIDGGLSYVSSGTFTDLGNGNYPSLVKNGYGCTVFVDTFEITSGDAPAAPAAGDDATYGEGEAPIDIWATAASGGQLYWYNSPSLDAIIGTGPSFTPFENVGTTVYYVTETVGGCESPSSTVTITINAQPDPPETLSQTICQGEPVPNLTATGSNLIWYSDPALTSVVGAGSSYITGQTAVGTYNYYVTQTVLNVTSEASPVSLTINAVPSEPTATDVGICYGNPTPDLEATTGNNITWYRNASLTDTLHQGNTYSTGETAAGTSKTYYVTQNEDNCESNYTAVDLEIYEILDPPVAPDVTTCFSGSGQDLVAVGTDIKWYDDSGLNNNVANGNTYATGISAAGTYTYYATQASLTGGCESNASTVTLTINAIPDAPVSENDTICYGEDNPELIASGNNVEWYNSVTLAPVIGTGNNYTPLVTDAGTYTYYATQTENDCQSSSTTVIFQIKESPVISAVTDTNQTACNSKDGAIWVTASTLTANPLEYSFDGGTTWQSDEYIRLIGNGNYPLVVKNTVACEYVGETVVITDGGNVQSPVPAQNATYCDGDAINDLTINSIYGTPDSVLWYDDPNLNNLVGTGQTFSPPNVIGENVYYSVETRGGCQSPSTNDTVRIYAIPSEPLTDDVDACVGSQIPNIEATGTDIEWFSDAPGTPLVYSGSSFATGQVDEGIYNYYVTQTIDGCTSPFKTVVLSIDPVPSAPSADNDEVCYGFAVPDLSATGTNVNWYDNSDLSHLVNSGNSYTTGLAQVGTYTFYVTQTTSCTSDITAVSLTIHPIPSAPTSTDEEVCEGFTVPYLAASGSNVKWYDDAALTNKVWDGSIYVTGVTAPASYIYYATQTENNCESPDVEVNLVIYATPATPVADDKTVCQNIDIPDLSTTGTNVKWYYDQYLNIELDTGEVFATGKTQPGSYTYYVTQTINGCESNDDDATLTINSIPVIVSENSTNESTCDAADGSIIVTAAGLEPIAYSIDAGTTYTTDAEGDGETWTNLAAGVYPVVIHDPNSCIVEGSDVVITSGDAPPSPSTTGGYTICDGGTITSITASDAFGGTLTWYTDPGLTSVYTTGATMTPINTIGVTTYYVTETTGCESAPTAVIVTINPLPDKPVITDVSICGDEPTPELQAFGDGISWYDDAGLNNLVNVGNTYNTGITTDGTYPFYVTQTIDNCEGPDTTITLYIGTVPDAVTPEDETICFGQATPDLNTAGTAVQWYADQNLTNVLGSGDSYTPDVSNVGYYLYYATQTENGCESQSATFSYTINEVPSTPVADNVIICEGEATPNLTTTGSGVQWYNSINVVVNYTNSYNTGIVAAGTYVYTVSQTLNNCESERDTATLTINTVPLPPAVSDVDYCYGEEAIVSATGTEIQWYSNPGLTDLLENGDTYATGKTSVGAYTYFVTQTQNNCESNYDVLNMVINSLPNITSQASTDQITCTSNDGTITLAATGIGNIEYSIDNGITFPVLNINNGSFTGLTTGSYQVVVRHNNGCTIDGNEIVISAGGAPDPPTAGTDATYCDGDAIADMTASAPSGTLYWFDDPQLTNNIGSGGTLSPGSAVGTAVYYVVDSLGGCSSAPSSVQITVNELPTQYNVVGGGNYCLGGAGKVITTQHSEKNVNYQLFVDGSQIGAPLPGSSSGDPVSFGFQTTAGNYTVIATSTTTSCADNMTGSADIIIDTLPNVYNVIGSGNDCYGGPGIAMQLSGSESGINYQLYIGDNTEVGSPIPGSAGSTLTFGNMTQTGTYTVVATNASTGCTNDMNLSGTVTIYDLPEKFNMYQTDSYCDGDAGVEIGISGSETGVSYQLYKNDVIFGIPQSGDGQPISFGYQTDSATYTVIATNTYSCKDTMNGSAVISINPLPTTHTLDFASGGSYCADGNGVELILDNSDAGIEYQLYLSGNATGAPVPGVGGQISFGVLSAGTYTAAATNTTTGCLENMVGTPQIKIDPLPTAYDISGGGSYCEGLSGIAVDLNNSQSGVTYYFYLDGVEVTTMNGINGVSLSQTFTEAGVYTIHAVNNTTGCEQDMNGSATITINELPQIYNVTPVDGYYCSGDQDGVAIGLDNSEADVKYELYRAGVLIENKIGLGVGFNFTGQTTTGTYNVVATNNANCTENMTGTSTVHVNPLPDGIIQNTLNPTNGCTPLNAQFTFIQSNTVVIDTFIWNFDDGTIDTTDATITTVNHTYYNNYNSTITPDFSVSAISSDGCVFTNIQTISIYPEVVAGFNVIDTAGCSRFDVSFINTSQGNQPSYDWSFGNEGTSSEINPTHGFIYSKDTSVLVTLIAVSADFCKDTTTQLIYVYESPHSEFSVQEESITAPDSIHLINLTVESNNSAGWNYSWDFYDGGSSTEIDPVHFYDWAGYYDITLTAYDNECSDDYVITYVVQARTPEVYYLFDSAGCAPFTVKFPDSTKYARNWEWNFGDGYTSTSKEPTHLFDQPGTYRILLKALAPDVDGNNIYDQATVSEIEVYNKPYVEFQFDKYLVFIYTDSVIFTNRSDNLDYIYSWNFGDGETSNEINPSHIYQVEGTYQVELHATNSEGCVDSVKHGDIIAQEADKLYFPTVFFPIPGGEPDNTVTSERNTSLFYPLVGTGVSEEGYEFSIYDRWGELIFQTKELNKGWTGYKDGILLKQGVYVWIVRGKYDNGDPLGPETGNITLLR